MPESLYCHACAATTASEARYSNAGDRVCPACESDFIEITEVPAQQAPSAQARRRANGANGGPNQGYHRHFTTPGGHNVHLHVVTSLGGIPGPLESLLNSAEPADLAALLQSMQGVNLRPFNLPPGVSPGDYGPNGGAAFDDLMVQLMEAHQPQAAPTSRDTLSTLPRRKVRSAGAPSDVISNTISNQPAACACGEPCSVCHDPMEEHTEVLELPCQHCYHEDCITSWLKDHNTCPVCRKELPVDQELQRQQQQERQQRFEQEVQRQPAGLQSLFSALNPFHLFGGGPGVAAGPQGRAAAAEAAPQHGNAPAARAAPDPTAYQLPGGTMARFEVVQTSLRELETRLQHLVSTGNPSEDDLQAIEDHLRRVQLQNTRLQGAHDSAVRALQTEFAHDRAIAQLTTELRAELGDADPMADLHAPHAGSDSTSLPDLIASDDEHEDEPDLPAPSPPHLQDVANAAQADAELHNPDEMPVLVTSSDSGSDDVPALESDSDDDGEDLVPIHDSDYEEESLSDENSAFDEMPPLLPAGYTSSFTELGANHHQPMTLDQLDAVDQLSHVMEESAGVAASGNRVVEQAVIGNRLHVPADQQHASEPSSAAASGTAARDALEFLSPERRVVQRINSQSTPQNPAGPLQSQPSGLALAAAPVRNPAGVIVNQRPVSQAGMDLELPRTVSSRLGTSSEGGNHSALRSHPLSHTPSRKRSFTPSEASSSPGAPATLTHDSVDGQGRQTERSSEGSSQRPRGLMAPVSWAARGAGRLMGSLLRRDSNNRQ